MSKSVVLYPFAVQIYKISFNNCKFPKKILIFAAQEVGFQPLTVLFNNERTKQQKNKENKTTIPLPPMYCHTIAHIETDFATKFGVPRQSGLIPELEARIVFEPPFRSVDALRGLEGFSHLWLIWEFSESTKPETTKQHINKTTKEQNNPIPWSPTVRPPRLGGNVRMGVFATRSPFRPNPIGLSSVQISRIDLSTPHGPIIYVRGADLMNGTPILDIKPYLPFTDSHPEATGGYTDQTRQQEPLEVIVPEDVRTTLFNILGAERFAALCQVLSQDPRPHYQQDPERVYGLEFAGIEVHFRVDGARLILQ